MTFSFSERVRLANNSISGDIPNSWTSASGLKILDLSGNKLKGQLPSTLADAPSLNKLRVSNNSLTGSIPRSYYNMQTLEELYIDQNSLTGTLSQLEEPLYVGVHEFVINDNSFEGRAPTEQFEKTETLST